MLFRSVLVTVIAICSALALSSDPDVDGDESRVVNYTVYLLDLISRRLLVGHNMEVSDVTFDLSKFQECFGYIQSSLKGLLASDRAR